MTITRKSSIAPRLPANRRSALRAVLVLACGALPVLPLAAFAGYAALIGVLMLADLEAWGLLLLLWGSAGLFGTVALWLAAFNFRHVVVVIGLLIGCVAVSPLAYWIPRSSDWVPVSVPSIALFGPLATACVLLIETGYRIHADSPDRRKLSARFFFAICMLAIAASAVSIALIGRQ